MSTAKEMGSVVGKTGTLQTDKLRFDVEIHDVRCSFGRTDYLVRPVAGKDEAWVSADRVRVN